MERGVLEAAAWVWYPHDESICPSAHILATSQSSHVFPCECGNNDFTKLSTSVAKIYSMLKE